MQISARFLHWGRTPTSRANADSMRNCRSLAHVSHMALNGSEAVAISNSPSPFGALGSSLWHRRLGFRDALRKSPALAAEYAELKLRLAETFRLDREAYTEAKAPFVQRVLSELNAPECSLLTGPVEGRHPDLPP